MNALIWKKYKWMTQDLRNIIRYFIVPIVILLMLAFSRNKNALLCYFPFISITLGLIFDQIDIEDMVQKEYAMYTPMTIKKSWVFNSVISWIIRFVYSILILVIGMIVYKFYYGFWYASWKFFIYGIVNGVSAFGVILFANQYEIDFSMWKQWLCFMWVPSVILFTLMLEGKTINFIPTKFEYCIYLLIFSSLLVVFSFWQSKNVTTEKLISTIVKPRKYIVEKFDILDD